jgi:AraC-like DNA-binding protein
MKTQWGGIEYYSTIIADQTRGRAYLVGGNADMHTQPEKGFRHYVLRIDYAEATDGKPAPLTLYYTDPIQDMPDYTPVLTPEGNLLIAGGLTTAVSNFSPSAHAYVLRIGDGTADLSESNHPWWWLAALAAATVVAVGFLVRKYRRHKAFRLAEASAEAAAIGSTESTTELMQRINELMERKKLYLDSELKVSDIAHAFKLHRNDISACINSQTGCTFTQYVNRYRVDYAKQLLRQQPEKKISTVWTEAGFGTEQTFFKIFRAATGVSPKEWAAQCNNLSENAKID